MKWLSLSLLILLIPSVGQAAYNETLVLKKVSDDGNQFVFVRKDGPPPWNGITIKDPQTKTMLYEAKVTKCNNTACLGTVVRNHSGLKLRLDDEYVHSYNEKPIQYDPEKAPKVEEAKKPELNEVPVEPVKEPEPPKPVEPPPAPVVKEKPKPAPKPSAQPKVVPAKVVEEKPGPMDRQLYAAYGSPIGPGFKLGYYKNFESYQFGATFAKISSTTNSVSIDGMLLGLSALKTIYQVSPSIDLNLLSELGLAKATLDFTGVDVDGPKPNESTYFFALGGEGRINLERLSFSIRSGMSKAGFAASYTGTYQKFNNPYGTILVFLEIGAYYRF